MANSDFTDIPYPIINPPSTPYGVESFNNLNDFKAGRGSNSMGMDSQGLWLGADKFVDAPFRVDMNGNATISSIVLTGGTISYGKTSFSDATNAGYFISALGIYFGSAADASRLKYTIADGTLDLIGTVSGRSTATLAAAINSSGNFIKEVINTSFDTSAKNILGAFTFGVSGAIQIGTYSFGVSGDLRISPNGILGRDSAGNTTFSIDGTTGNATFGGTLVAASGTFGTITAGSFSGVTITGSTIQTASGTVARIELTSANGLRSFDSSNKVRLRMPTDGNGMTFFTSTEASAGRIQGYVVSGGILDGTRFINIDNNGTAGDGNFSVDNIFAVGGEAYFTGMVHFLGGTSISGGTISLVAGDTVNLGDVCKIHTDGTAKIGDANAQTVPCLVIASATITSGNTGNYYLPGQKVAGYTGLTIGSPVYLSITGTTGNTITQTIPTTTGDMVQVLGVAVSATEILFAPSSMVIIRS